MARPKKDGLDYFPVDVDPDEKIEAIELMHKNNGTIWILRFWQKAYKRMTGVVDFRGLFAELFANKCRITIEEHEKILKTAVSVEFCYEIEPGVYTSNGIQKRISSVSKERSTAITRQKVKDSKVKDSKVKDSKVKDSPDYSPNNSEQSPNNKIDSFKMDVNKHIEYPESMRYEFVEYWTELNPSKTKMKYELQKTWDTSRRLSRWSRNNYNDKKTQYGTKKYTITDARRQMERLKNGF